MKSKCPYCDNIVCKNCEHIRPDITYYEFCDKCGNGFSFIASFEQVEKGTWTWVPKVLNEVGRT